jgi:hypothetical protein
MLFPTRNEIELQIPTVFLPSTPLPTCINTERGMFLLICLLPLFHSSTNNAKRETNLQQRYKTQKCESILRDFESDIWDNIAKSTLTPSPHIFHFPFVSTPTEYCTKEPLHISARYKMYDRCFYCFP